VALKTDIRGLVHEYPGYFEVGREQIRQFAKAIKADDPATFDDNAAHDLGYATIVAPPTFITIFAMLLQQHFFQNVDIGLETLQIVQVDQKFVYHKPIQVGDKLFGTMYVHSVNERFGADIVVTRNVCTNDKGEMVLEAFTTLMAHEGDNSISVRWDPESGQVMRKAVGE
jgi:meromycolic acid (3R)-3-hydroxyacyl-[acyl-carrier protein] dehydratase HadC